MSEPSKSVTPPAVAESVPAETAATELPKEIGGRGGLDPTRYGDWEKSGRCIDF
jgi:hypothetical protein